MLFDQPLSIKPKLQHRFAVVRVTWLYYHGLCVVQLGLSLNFEQTVGLSHDYMGAVWNKRPCK